MSIRMSYFVNFELAISAALVVMLLPAVSSRVEDAWVESGLELRLFRDGMNQPRGMHVLDNGDILIVQRLKGEGNHNVAVAWDDDGDGAADAVVPILFAPGSLRANHGIVFHDGYVYASSDTTVWRWTFTPGQRSPGPNSNSAEIVIENMNANGRGGAPQGHTTRTLIVGNESRMYVSVGSAGNVDKDSHRSRIRRFSLLEFKPGKPFDFQKGEVFADGLRNEVGLAFDRFGVLWGVENGADKLKRGDLGGDIHNDNPAEELNRFPESSAGKFFGYPYCFTEYKLDHAKAQGRGGQWSWPYSKKTDQWCRENAEPAILAMQAHSAPLGITFYSGKQSADCEEKRPYALPEEYIGDAFVAFHGSWNRDIPTGYKIVRIPMNASGFPVNGAMTDPVDVVRHKGEGAKWPSNLRPVDVKFDPCGRLYFTSDKNNEMYVIGSLNPAPTNSPTAETPNAITGAPTNDPTTAAPTASPSSPPSNILEDELRDKDDSDKTGAPAAEISDAKRRVQIGIAIGMTCSIAAFIAAVRMLAKYQ